MRLIGTILLLFVSLNGYATCFDGKSEEMSHYIYMEEDELQYEYCYCVHLKSVSMEYGYVEEAIRRGEEIKKMQRVFKKEYETEPKECEK